MENFDRENIDELLEIRQIRQYFPPSKICAVRYLTQFMYRPGKAEYKWHAPMYACIAKQQILH